MINYTRQERTVPYKWYILAPLIAMSGGLLGILAAGMENQSYGLFLGAFIAAPVIEETVKPCGVYLLLAKWPHVLTSQRYTAFLAALAGLSFGLIESTMYVHVFFPEHSQEMVVWRYTVCLLLHTGCSFIVGFGINQQLVAWVRTEVPLLKGNRIYFLLPMLIHSLYNIGAVFWYN